MRSLLKITQETKLASAVGGILSRPLAAVAIAGGLSVLTLAASLYLFMFAGRELLPPPPLAELPVSRFLEPVPMNSIPEVTPTYVEVPALPEVLDAPDNLALPDVPVVPVAPAAPVIVASAIPETAAPVAQINTTDTVADYTLALFSGDEDDDDDGDSSSSSHRAKPKKSKNEHSSNDRHKSSRHAD
jgi:hypothetical protein